jgi:hypothetical protein
MGDFKISSLAKAVVAFFLGLIGWLLRKGADDRKNLDDSKYREEEDTTYVGKVIKIESLHDKRVSEIDGIDLSDDRIDELLSTYPDQDPAPRPPKT